MQATAPAPPGRRRGDVVGVGVAGRAEDLGRGSWRPAPRRASHSSSTRTAAPSAMTKPSRSASNGRETPDARQRGHVGEAGDAGGVMAASVPPVTMASHRP